MSYARHALKVFGICLAAALGLMAVSAVGAQAQTKGWLVNGVFITATKTFDAEIHPLKTTAPIERHMVLSSEALGAKVKILCEKLIVDDGLLFTGEATEGLATLLFSVCNTTLNGAASPVCQPKEPITSHVKFRAILHNSLTYLLFEPGTAGQPFVNIEFANAECILAPSQPVAGSLVAECLTEDLKSMEEDTTKRDLCLTDLIKHLVREAPVQTLFGASEGLTFAKKAMKLEGIVDLLMSGVDAGRTWGCHI